MGDQPVGATRTILLCALAFACLHGTRAAASEPCSASSWNLDGASSSPKEDGSATFVSTWNPVLDEIAACVSDPSHAYTCIEIQGQFDELAFSPGVIAAFGSEEAAQKARARARADAVREKLEEKGVGPERLRQRSPGASPTFRGVRLTLLSECLPRAELSESDRQALAEARAIIANPPTRTVEVVREVKVPTGGFDLPFPLYTEAGLHGGLAFPEAGPALSPIVSVAIGGKVDQVYGRMEGRIASDTAESRRGGWGLRAAGGMELHSLLALGLVGDLQWSSVGLSEAWLERSFRLGVEGTQCLIRLGEGSAFCLRQSLFPFGSLARRGTIRDGVLKVHEKVSEYLLSAELGLIFHYSL